MNRRSFLLGSAGLLAAPSIVRVSALMPVSTRALLPMTAGEVNRLRAICERQAMLIANPPLIGDNPALLRAFAQLLLPPARQWLTLEGVPFPAK